MHGSTGPGALRLEWRKASRSATDGERVEIASAPEYVAIRDSKNPESGMLRCSPEQFRLLLDAVRNGKSRI